MPPPKAEGVQFVNQRGVIAIGDIDDHLGVVRQFNQETVSPPIPGGDHVYFQEPGGGVN